jgi:hypothetical protein
MIDSVRSTNRFIVFSLLVSLCFATQLSTYLEAQQEPDSTSAFPEEISLEWEFIEDYVKFTIECTTDGYCGIGLGN